jgi:hypothetical protein
MARLALAAAAGLLFALGPGCGRDSGDPVDRAERSISRQRIDKTGRRLSDDTMAGRYYASPESDSTVALLLGRLRASGLARVDRAALLLAEHPACFVHDFSVTLHRLGRFTYLGEWNGDRERAAVAGRDFVPLVFSRDGEIIGEVRRLAALPSAERPLARDPALDGRVVVVPERAWDAALQPDDATLYRVARALASQGAAAVLFEAGAGLLQVASTTYPSHLTSEQLAATRSARGSIANLHADRLSQASQAQAWRVAPERTVPAFVVRRSWSARLHDGDRIVLRCHLEPEVSLAQNVLVGFRGRSRPDEIVLVGVHYDHTGINAQGDVLNGADDNASGVAALLEIASALVPLRGALGRSVVLAFFSAGREGLQGSESFLTDLPQLLGGDARLVSMLAMRALGRNGDEPLLVVGGQSHPEMAAVLERQDQRDPSSRPPLGLRLALDESTGVARLEVVPSRGSDHLTFARAGVPSILLTAGLDPILYDQPDDDWRDVDADKVTRAARLVFRTVYELANPGDLVPASPAGTR